MNQFGGDPICIVKCRQNGISSKPFTGSRYFQCRCGWGCKLVEERARGRESESKDPGTPHPLSDHTSSRCPSLFSGSAPGGGCWASGLSDSASTSLTAAALGSDTSLQDPRHSVERGRWECRIRYKFESVPNPKVRDCRVDVTFYNRFWQDYTTPFLLCAAKQRNKYNLWKSFQFVNLYVQLVAVCFIISGWSELCELTKYRVAI